MKNSQTPHDITHHMKKQTHEENFFIRKPKQISFLPKPKLEFGGSLLTGKRKSKRILSFFKTYALCL